MRRREKAAEEGNDWLFLELMFIKSARKEAEKSFVLTSISSPSSHHQPVEASAELYYISQATSPLIEFDPPSVVEKVFVFLLLLQRDDKRETFSSFHRDFARYSIHKQSPEGGFA